MKLCAYTYLNSMLLFVITKSKDSKDSFRYLNGSKVMFSLSFSVIPDSHHSLQSTSGLDLM